MSLCRIAVRWGWKGWEVGRGTWTAKRLVAFGSQQCLPLSGTRNTGEAPRSVLNNIPLTWRQLGEWDDKRKDLIFNLYLFSSINSILRQPYFTSCTKCSYTSELGLLKKIIPQINIEFLLCVSHCENMMNGGNSGRKDWFLLTGGKECSH